MKTEKNTTGDRENERPVILGAVVASLFTLIFGVGYRAVAGWLEAPPSATPIAQGTLDRLPIQINSWIGSDRPLDPNIIERTDTDAHVSRTYTKSDGGASVWLWIASGVRVRDLMPHRPEVCYTGQGWTLKDQKLQELPLGDNAMLPYNLMEFSRGALGTEKTLVLYYYIVDGQYCQNVSDFRYDVFRRIGYVTQVQIVASVKTSLTRDATESMLLRFAEDSAGPIGRLFESPTEMGPQGQGAEERK